MRRVELVDDSLEDRIRQNVPNDGICHLLAVHVVGAPFDGLANLTDSNITFRIRLFRRSQQTLKFLGLL